MLYHLFFFFFFFSSAAGDLYAMRDVGEPGLCCPLVAESEYRFRGWDCGSLG